MTEPLDTTRLRNLRTMGIVEGCSTLVLFGIAMPLKYFGDMPLAVTIVGSIHGLLFVVFSVMCFLAIERVPIGRRLGFAGIAGAVFPFGPFVVDHWLKKLADVERKER